MNRFLWLVVAAALIVSAAAQAAQKPKGFIFHEAPKTVPDVSFQNEAGEATELSDFRGKVILLNIWATWCPPCRHEMPTLDRLQGKLGGPSFEVIALSIDKAGQKVVRKFFSEINVKNLSLYIDPSAEAGRALQVFGLPVTLLLNRNGQELGRLIGPAEWDAR